VRVVRAERSGIASLSTWRSPYVLVVSLPRISIIMNGRKQQRGVLTRDCGHEAFQHVSFRDPEPVAGHDSQSPDTPEQILASQHVSTS